MKKRARGNDRGGKHTWHVILTCLVAAAGLLVISAITILLLADSKKPKTEAAAVPVH